MLRSDRVVGARNMVSLLFCTIRRDGRDVWPLVVNIVHDIDRGVVTPSRRARPMRHCADAISIRRPGQLRRIMMRRHDHAEFFVIGYMTSSRS